jgi:peptide/nickel transport system permease protein
VADIAVIEEQLEVERAELGPSHAGPRSRRRRVIVGAGILVAIALLGIFVPIVSSYGTNQFSGRPLQGPSLTHLFGTDEFGRDVFVRTWSAARIDLFVAFVGVLVPLLTGTVIGVAVGSTQRQWIDSIVMRIVDAILAFPFVILVLALVVVLGTSSGLGPLPAGLPSLFVAIFCVSWTY